MNCKTDVKLMCPPAGNLQHEGVMVERRKRFQINKESDQYAESLMVLVSIKSYQFSFLHIPKVTVLKKESVPVKMAAVCVVFRQFNLFCPTGVETLKNNQLSIFHPSGNVFSATRGYWCSCSFIYLLLYGCLSITVTFQLAGSADSQ